MSGIRLALMAPFAAAACATAPAPPESPGCVDRIRELDARIEHRGVRDAQARPVEGFPYLRVDRPLASFRETARTGAAVRRALADRLRALDLEARGFEIANLGLAPAEAAATAERVRDCGARALEAALADAGSATRLLDAVRVPDDYSTLERFLGLYALTRYPFYAGVTRYQDGVREAFRAAPSGIATQRFAPPAAAPMPRAAQAEAIARASDNPLGVPEPTGDALDRLLAAHAPAYELEQTGDFDRPGALRWTRHGAPPAVDAGDPVVYRMATWTRYRGRALLQLVYTIWFAARPADSPFDLLSGALDGVVWRVTLAPDGEPLVYDSMHPCGCYHMFFPTPRARPVAAPQDGIEWMFSPQSLPRVAEGERPVLRIATRTHYIEGVALERTDAGGTRYALRPYDALRSLPRAAGGRASVFAPDGLVDGTQRAERFLFWPMGIDSPGAMRQWGRHATAFVGRRHFDDADLIEKRFVLDLR